MFNLFNNDKQKLHDERKTVKRCDLLKMKTSAEIDLSNDSSFDYVWSCFVQYWIIIIKANGLIKTPSKPFFSHAFSLKAVKPVLSYQLPKSSKSSRKHLAALVYVTLGWPFYLLYLQFSFASVHTLFTVVQCQWIDDRRSDIHVYWLLSTEALWGRRTDTLTRLDGVSEVSRSRCTNLSSLTYWIWITCHFSLLR